MPTSELAAKMIPQVNKYGEENLDVAVFVNPHMSMACIMSQLVNWIVPHFTAQL